MNTEIFLIRHAQSYPSVHINHEEWPLSEVGQNQAKRLAHLLGELEIEIIYSSPYLRCLETVRPFAQQRRVEVAVCPDLRERLVAAEVIENFHEVWHRSWDDFHFSLPGCESAFQCQTRFGQAIREIARIHPGGRVGISSHGYAISLFLHSLDHSFDRHQAARIRNPDLFRIHYREDQFAWDGSFEIPLDFHDWSTDYRETPIDWGDE